MKKIIITSYVMLCLGLFAAMPSFAQDTKNDAGNKNEPVKKKQGDNTGSGLEGGFNFANMDVQYPGNGNTYNFRTGGRFGFVIDGPLSRQIYLQPGLFYSGNGTVITNNDGVNSLTSRATITAIEMPVNLLYKTGDPGGNRFFVGAGLYVAYNVLAQSVDITTNLINGSSQTTNNTYKIGSQNGVDDMKATDLGVGLTAGYELAGGLYFRFRFQRGLSNMSPNDGTTIHTMSIGLQLGYMFHKKGFVYSKGVKKEKAPKAHTRNAYQED